MTACPCGSGQAFDACCGRFLAGADAPTPELLLRRRYTAYVRGDAAYLAKTWHPATRPDLRGIAPAAWVALDIRASGPDWVEFVAQLRVGDQLHVLHELSSFVREGGRWLYHSGKDGRKFSKLMK
jgi:SEC-C motif-containing protein